MKTDLIYGVEDRPPFKDAIFAALQHLLAIFVAIITPPLIIAGALKLDVEKTSFLVSMSLFVSGISTFIQCKRFGPVGARLLCIQGTSFSFIGPIITTGLMGGLPLIFGVCMAAAPVEMVISRTFRYMRNIITPLVHLSKAQIVQEAIKLKVPLEHTWSCYKEEKEACGVCDSCRLRLNGFKIAGVKDPISYKVL